MHQQTDGKYCDHCQKTVVDFTTMTDTQLANFFKQKQGDVCGRFYDDQLEKEIALPKKALPWLKYFFTITLPAFLYSQKSYSQDSKVKEKITLIKRIKKQEIISNIPSEKDSTQNTFIDLEPIVINSNALGRYVRITMGATISGIRYTSYNSFQQDHKKTNDFNIYPNPVLQNTKMNIKWSNQINTNQYVEIFDANGRLLQKEEIIVHYKTQNAFIILNQMPKGFYIIKITDTKAKLILSKEFIIN